MSRKWACELSRAVAWWTVLGLSLATGVQEFHHI